MQCCCFSLFLDIIVVSHRQCFCLFFVKKLNINLGESFFCWVGRERGGLQSNEIVLERS